MIPNRITAHPGEILVEEYLKPLKLSANALAKALGVPTNRITSIIHGDRSVTADTALRLARYFKTNPQFWLNMQAMHDLTTAQSEHGKEIERTVTPIAA